MDDTRAPVTELLHAWGEGDPEALGALIESIHTELKGMCQHAMVGERASHSLEPTGLVNEVYLRLAALDQVSFENRRPFFAFAARLMRRVLVEEARAKGAQKRGGDQQRVEIEADHLPDRVQEIDVLVLNDLLAELEEQDPLIVRIIELRFFTGLKETEVAETLKISRSRVQREWRFAKRWLAARLR